MNIVKRFSLFAFVSLLMPVLAFADDVLPTKDFLEQVWNTISALGGLSWAGRIAALLVLAIALTKVSFMRPLWDKLGAAKVLLAPVLAIIVGIVTMASAGSLSAAGVAAYLFAGAGAVVLHELLDGVKGLPGLGDKYVALITFIQSFLGGKK